MKNFSLYAKYYNLIYENKNYNSESKYIDEIIKELNPKCVNLCDLGCGTGSYSFAFEKIGYKVEGIDLSSNMIKLANQKKE